MSMRTVIIYAEKYKPRQAVVLPHETKRVAEEADAAWVVEQGEVELPGLSKQRRLFSVIRFEKIVRVLGKEPIR